MIDLTTKDLPNAITVNGKSIFLKTDFRVWLRFWKEPNIKLADVIENVDIELTKEEIEEVKVKLNEFRNNPSVTPNYNKASNGEKIIDYYLDGSYIYSAFMTQYHIDLLEVDMHWHKFKALADDLSVGIISHAKKARGYQKPSKKYDNDKYWSEERKAWSFPKVLSDEEKKKIDEFNKYFE